MQTQAPIGIFDSGVGGTSIWKEIVQLLPLEHTIYLADSINAPYGSKPKQAIIDLSKKNTEKLIELGAKVIVVACNTATTNAIDILRTTYDIPFVGIEPAIKPAAIQSQTHAVGILATKGTLSSALFETTSKQFAGSTKIIEVIGEGLVPLIENNQLDSDETRNLLIRYIAPMLEAQIDYLVLGCSHYPYLIPQLREMLPENVKIIDSGEAVARQTQRLLQQFRIAAQTQQKVTHKMFTNANPDVLEMIVRNAGWTNHAFAKAYFEKLNF